VLVAVIDEVKTTNIMRRVQWYVYTLIASLLIICVVQQNYIMSKPHIPRALLSAPAFTTTAVATTISTIKNESGQKHQSLTVVPPLTTAARAFDPTHLIPRHFEPKQTASQPSNSIGMLVYADLEYLTHPGITLAISSMQCYAAQHNYAFLLEVHKLGDGGYDAFDSKIAAVSKYMPYYEWLFVVDADMVIVNTTRKLEELITGDVHLIFSQRVRHPEVMGSWWAVKRSAYSEGWIWSWRKFFPCMKANRRKHFHNNDNGALLVMLLDTLVSNDDASSCIKIWAHAPDVNAYIKFVECFARLIRTVRHTRHPIRILPTNYAARHLELMWAKHGSNGVPANSYWNRLVQTDFFVHTKEPELLLRPQDANCTSNSNLISAHMFYSRSEGIASVRAELARFGHPDAVCYPRCVPLASGEGPLLESYTLTPQQHCPEGN
jgi:hypothetical protein